MKQRERDCENEHHHASIKLKRANLPKSQRVEPEGFRHTCAGCAYDLGFDDGVKWAKERIEGYLKNDRV